MWKIALIIWVPLWSWFAWWTVRRMRTLNDGRFDRLWAGRTALLLGACVWIVVVLGFGNFLLQSGSHGVSLVLWLLGIGLYALPLILWITYFASVMALSMLASLRTRKR